MNRETKELAEKLGINTTKPIVISNLSHYGAKEAMLAIKEFGGLHEDITSLQGKQNEFKKFAKNCKDEPKAIKAIYDLDLDTNLAWVFNDSGKFGNLAVNCKDEPEAIKAIKDLNLYPDLAWNHKGSDNFERLAKNCRDEPGAIKAIKDLKLDNKLAWNLDYHHGFDILAKNCKEEPQAIKAMKENLEISGELSWVAGNQEDFQTFAKNCRDEPKAIEAIKDLNLYPDLAWDSNRQEEFKTLAENCNNEPEAIKAMKELEPGISPTGKEFNALAKISKLEGFDLVKEFLIDNPDVERKNIIDSTWVKNIAKTLSEEPTTKVTDADKTAGKDKLNDISIPK